MKKVVIFMACICLICLTGCGKNRLVCTDTTKEDDFSNESKYVFTFDGEKVKKATFTSSSTLSGTNNKKEVIEAYQKSAEKEASLYNETTGVKAQVTKDKNKITLKVDIDTAKLSEDDLLNYELDLKKAQLKENLEKAGYTCR